MTMQERIAKADKEAREQHKADMARLAALPDRPNRNRFESMLNW